MTAQVIPFPLWGTVEMGRYATRVRVREGAYAGARGVIVRVVHPGAVMVRLTIRGRELAIPFGPSELEETR